MRPFDFVGKEKLDLNKQSHRDVVIKRNKKLEKYLENDISIYENILKVELHVRVEFNCLKCGNFLQEDEENDLDDYDNMNLNFPKLKCSCCETSYHYSKKNEAYQISLKKTEIVKKEKK